MAKIANLRFAPFLLILAVGAGFSPHGQAAEKPEAKEAASGAASPKAAPRVKKPKLDHSGRKRVGKASFYSKKFAGKKMADGTPMKPQGNNAASKTLPLGTTARVTNLETGKSAEVTIQDRGPHVKGRIVDLSPATAEKIGIDREDGVAKVEVAPIAVPQPDGSVKPGAAAPEGRSESASRSGTGKKRPQ